MPGRGDVSTGCCPAGCGCGTGIAGNGGPGCIKGDYKGDVQHVEREPFSNVPAAVAPQMLDALPLPSSRAGPKRSFQPFPAATRSVPSLTVSDLPSQIKAKGSINQMRRAA